MTDKARRTPHPIFLTTREVQDCLRVTPRTIYRLIESRELPAVRVGRRWRFRRRDLDEWFDRQRGAGRAS
jgi:excisionase family DNA binding protein